MIDAVETVGYHNGISETALFFDPEIREELKQVLGQIVTIENPFTRL